MKKIIPCILAIITIISAVIIPANADYNSALSDKTVYSDCLYLLCADNDEVVFQKNANKQTHPASLTKVITATVVLENCHNLDEMITVPESCIRELDGTGSSLGGLKAGEELSLYNMLCCLLLQSANEAATTLADFVADGDRDAFIAKMNELAQRLGCEDSHFVNPHGLDDDDQYVSARDMAVFFKYAYTFDAFKEICGMTSYTLPETNLQKSRTIHTTNYTLIKNYSDYYNRNIKGGKTGSTSIAGHCLVSIASNNGYNYIGVAMNAPKQNIDTDTPLENCAFVDTKMMYDWVFQSLRLVCIADPDRVVAQLPVKYGKSTDNVSLAPAQKSFKLMPKGTDNSALMVKIKDDGKKKTLKAPIKKGEYIAQGDIYYSDEVIATIDLVASSDVKSGLFMRIATPVKAVFSTLLFKLAALIVISFFIILVIRRKKIRERKNQQIKVVDFNDIMKSKKR